MNPFSIFYPLFFISHESTPPQRLWLETNKMGGKKTWDRWHRHRQQTFLLVVTDFDKDPGADRPKKFFSLVGQQ
jgi:hypothetical protein